MYSREKWLKFVFFSFDRGKINRWGIWTLLKNCFISLWKILSLKFTNQHLRLIVRINTLKNKHTTQNIK